MAIPVVDFSREGYKIRNLGMVMRILVFFIFGLFSYFHQLLNTIQLEYTRHQNVWSRWPLVQVACFWSEMPMFQRAGWNEEGRKEGLPLPPAFQYLIILVWRACDLNLVIMSSLAWKCQDFKLRSSLISIHKTTEKRAPQLWGIAILKPVNLPHKLFMSQESNIKKLFESATLPPSFLPSGT